MLDREFLILKEIHLILNKLVLFYIWFALFIKIVFLTLTLRLFISTVINSFISFHFLCIYCLIMWDAWYFVLFHQWWWKFCFPSWFLCREFSLYCVIIPSSWIVKVWGSMVRCVIHSIFPSFLNIPENRLASIFLNLWFKFFSLVKFWLKLFNLYWRFSIIVNHFINKLYCSIIPIIIF